MSGRTLSWGEINSAVEGLIEHHVENDPTINAYLIALSGLNAIKGMRGGARAAELAYRLADTFATAEAA